MLEKANWLHSVSRKKKILAKPEEEFQKFKATRFALEMSAINSPLATVLTALLAHFQSLLPPLTMDL